MLLRGLIQTILTLSLTQLVPVDGAILERAARLPTAESRSALLEAATLAGRQVSLPLSDQRAPSRVEEGSVGVVTSAKSVLVVDRQTGLTLYAKNPDEVRPVGSISKLMTALVFLQDAPDLGAAASVLNEDYRPGGRVYLAANDPVTVADLLHASLVGSDNTATMSLVRISRMSEVDFVSQMNTRAAELGMMATVFHDPTGLSPRNVSSARDIIRLLEEVQAEADIASTIVLPEVIITQGSGRAVTIPSTDELLTSFINQPPFAMLGGKTGYLPEAGYGIGVGVRHDGDGDVFIVLLGSDTKDTRVQEVKGLASWVYRVFEW